MTRSAACYLGPEGTFTHQAAALLHPGDHLDPKPTADQALQAVRAGAATLAVLPLDNTRNGLVTATLAALSTEPDMRIWGGTVVPVTFDAYTHPAAAQGEDVEVLSHPHALAQCRDFVNSIGAPTRDTPSTASACRDLKPGQIAIASPLCGDLYPLRRLASGVEDHSGEQTIFVSIRRGRPDRAEPRTAQPASSLLRVQPHRHRPGALAEVLTRLGVGGVNLTNMTALPDAALGRDRRVFYLLCSHESSTVLRDSVGAARAGAVVTVLGTFPLR